METPDTTHEHMTKRLPLIFSVASAVSLVFLTAYQSGLINDLRLNLRSTLNQLTKVELSLEEEMVKNEALQQEVLVLQDSVNLLSMTVNELNAKVAGLQKVIAQLNHNIQKKADKISSLTKEINKLQDKNQGNQERIDALTIERKKLLDQIVELDRKRIPIIEEKVESEQKALQQSSQKQKVESIIDQKQNATLSAPTPKINQAPGTAPSSNAEIPNGMSEQIKMSQQKRLANIVTNKKVNFESISLRNKENSNDLKKIKNDGWRYTFIDFSLENPEANALRDEYFLIQIFDLDNNQVVPMNEYNPGFPDSPQGSTGYLFQHTGKPVSVRYINTQLKQGSNYQVRLFYYKDKMVFPLRNGIQDIVKNGEVVAR